MHFDHIHPPFPCSFRPTPIYLPNQLHVHKEKKTELNLCCQNTVGCGIIPWSMVDLPGLGDILKESWFLFFSEAINSQYPLTQGWDFVPTSPLHIGIFFSGLNLHKSVWLLKMISIPFMRMTAAVTNRGLKLIMFIILHLWNPEVQKWVSWGSKIVVGCGREAILESFSVSKICGDSIAPGLFSLTSVCIGRPFRPLWFSLPL